MIQYRMIEKEEMDVQLFEGFKRHQVVTKCWRKLEGKWMIKDNPFVDDWSEAEYMYLVRCLRNTLTTGGMVYGAFEGKKLRGFTSVEASFLGSRGQYLDLSCIHVSEDIRHQGMGKKLFEKAKEWAKAHGAEKLYISAHSSIESQAFYKAMGCVEAEEYDKQHVENEPCDCQLECQL